MGGQDRPGDRDHAYPSWKVSDILNDPTVDVDTLQVKAVGASAAYDVPGKFVLQEGIDGELRILFVHRPTRAEIHVSRELPWTPNADIQMELEVIFVQGDRESEPFKLLALYCGGAYVDDEYKMNGVSVTPTSWELPATGGTQGISVTAEIDWTVESDSDWLTADVTGGSGGGMFTLIAAVNTEAKVRTGIIRVIGGIRPAIITVTQGGANAGVFTVDGMVFKILTAYAAADMVQVGDGTFNAIDHSVVTAKIPATVVNDRRTYSVTGIDNKAFLNCRNLAGITIPDSVTRIGSFAFNDCRSLTSVTIPKSVISIGNYAFDRCNRLSEVYFDGDKPIVGSSVFLRVAPGAVAYVYPSAQGFPAEGQLWIGLVVKYRDDSFADDANDNNSDDNPGGNGFIDDPGKGVLASAPSYPQPAPDQPPVFTPPPDQTPTIKQVVHKLLAVAQKLVSILSTML